MKKKDLREGLLVMDRNTTYGGRAYKVLSVETGWKLYTTGYTRTQTDTTVLLELVSMEGATLQGSQNTLRLNRLITLVEWKKTKKENDLERAKQRADAQAQDVIAKARNARHKALGLPGLPYCETTSRIELSGTERDALMDMVESLMDRVKKNEA